MSGDTTYIADFQWLLRDLEEGLDLLNRYDHEAPIREEYSKEFLLGYFLETRGMLIRLKGALERVPQPASEAADSLLQRARIVEEGFERIVHAAGPSLLEVLRAAFTPEAFRREVDDFIARTQKALAERKVPSWEGWKEEAADLFLERDKLALLLEGAEEVAQRIAAGPEARRFLGEAQAVAGQIDAAMQANLVAFAPARDFLARYRHRFHATETPFWWWQVELPEVPEAVREIFPTLLALIREHLGGCLPDLGILLRRGRELVDLSRAQLQELMLGWLQAQPAVLRAAGEAPQTWPVLLLDDQGAVIGELPGVLRFGPKVEAGEFLAVLQLPDRSVDGSPAWATIDLGEQGSYVIPARVRGDVVSIQAKILEDATAEFPASSIRVAILPAAPTS